MCGSERGLLCCCVWHCASLGRHVGLLVRFRRVAAALGRCASVVVCVDARDARRCVSTLRLGRQTPSCCCSACVSLAALAAFTGCSPLLWCCLCVPSACFARAWYRCVSVAVSLLVEWDDGVKYLWAAWLCRFGGRSPTLLCMSYTMYLGRFSFDFVRLMQCVAGSWLGSTAASSAMV